MIADVDVLKAIAIHRSPVAGAIGTAAILDVEADDELAGQLRRLTQEELLDRYQMHAMPGFFYKLTTKGRAYLTENGVDLAKLPPPKKKFKPEAESTKADNPGASPGLRASRTEAPAGNREKASAAAGTSATPATAPPTRLGGEEGQNSTRRIHRVEVAADNETDEEVPPVTKEKTDPRAALEQLVNKSGRWDAMKDLAKAAGLTRERARTVLNALVDEKKILAIGATSSKRFGRLGLAPPGAEEQAAAAPRPKAAKRKKRKTVEVKVRRPYTRKAAVVRVSPRIAKSGDKDSILAAATGSVVTMASFTKRGEIVVTHDGAVKHLNVDESREVVELVRAFDEAGLLPKAA